MVKFSIKWEFLKLSFGAYYYLSHIIETNSKNLSVARILNHSTIIIHDIVVNIIMCVTVCVCVCMPCRYETKWWPSQRKSELGR